MSTAHSMSDESGVSLESLRPALTKRFEVAECPIFDNRRQMAFFVDIWGRSISGLDPQSGASRTIQLGDFAGFIALSNSDRLIVGLRNRIVAIDWETGALEVMLALELDAAERVNDGCAAPDGSLCFGTMRIAADKPVGRIVRLDRNGRLETLAEDLTIPNGPVFDPKNRMLYTDSATGQIWRTAGGQAHAAPWCSIPKSSGKPDGLCCDSEGRVWCALWGGGEIACLSDDPTKISGLPVPATYVTAVGPLDATGEQCLVTTASRPFRGIGVKRGAFDGLVLRAELVGVRLRPSGRVDV